MNKSMCIQTYSRNSVSVLNACNALNTSCLVYVKNVSTLSVPCFLA